MKTGGTPGARSHPLVNWRTVCRPTGLGGLGVLDLDRFGRAMRLRWPWVAWTEANRPWQGMVTPCDKADMELFRASTYVTVGDREKCLFWHDRWRPGGSLRSQFPGLYAIATRKKRTVKKELHQRNWIQALANITNGHHMA